jgi:WD40 repeat protein
MTPWTKILAITALLCSLMDLDAGMLGSQADARQPGAKVPPAPGQSAVDLHGDPLPQGVLARMGTLRLHHLAYDVAYSNDGKFLVSSSTADIKIWDANTGRELHHLETGYGTRHVALSPDGSRLAAKGPGDFVYIWDIASGKELHRLPVHDQTDYPIKEVFGVAFSPDSKLLATVGFGGKFVVWDAVLGKERVVLPRLTHHYCILAFADHGRTLISHAFPVTPKTANKGATPGERDQTRLWEIASGKERKLFPGQQFIGISQDGKTLALTSDKRYTLHLVQWGTWKTLLTMKDFPGRVSALSFAPEGNTLAISSDDDPSVRLCDAHTGKVVHTVPLPGYVSAMAFSPDGKTIAVGACRADSDDHHRIRLFDTATGTERMLQPGHQGTIRQLRFLADDKTLASTSADNTFRLWQAADGKSIRALTLGKMPLAMTQDGSLVAACPKSVHKLEATVELWDTTTGTIRYRLTGHEEGVAEAAFSPDGTTLAVSVGLGGLYLWDTQTGKVLSKWMAGEDRHSRSHDPAFSPDGRILATGHNRCIVRLREVSSGRLIRELQEVPNVSQRLHVSQRWGDWRTGCFKITFAPDGKSVAAVAIPENLICVWDIAAGRLMWSCKAPAPRAENLEDTLHCLAYSPDGKMLFSAGHDGIIRIWDAATGKELRSLQGHRGFVSALAFSRDGARLASGSQDCTVLVWDLLEKTKP